MEPFSDPTRRLTEDGLWSLFTSQRREGPILNAHFIFEEKQTIGVADGVGSWSEKGVDAGEYARKLMSNFFSARKLSYRGK